MWLRKDSYVDDLGDDTVPGRLFGVRVVRLVQVE
jgi:hypothetical protein